MDKHCLQCGIYCCTWVYCCLCPLQDSWSISCCECNEPASNVTKEECCPCLHWLVTATICCSLVLTSYSLLFQKCCNIPKRSTLQDQESLTDKLLWIIGCCSYSFSIEMAGCSHKIWCGCCDKPWMYSHVDRKT